MTDNRSERKRARKKSKDLDHDKTYKKDGSKPHKERYPMQDILDEIGDDVIFKTSSNQFHFEDLKISQNPPFTPNSPVHKNYIQTSNGYKSVSIGRSTSNLQTSKEERRNYKQIQKWWMVFANICQGLFGGLSLAFLLLSFTTNTETNSKLNEMLINISYFLEIVTVVSVLDRMNLESFSSSTMSGRSMAWIILFAIYLTILLLVLTDSTSKYYGDEDESFNGTLSYEYIQSESPEIVYKTLSIVGLIYTSILENLS